MITEKDNLSLVRKITEEKVKHVVWSYDSDKCPSSDDFNFGFIKILSAEIKDDIVSVVHSFEEDGR